MNEKLSTVSSGSSVSDDRSIRQLREQNTKDSFNRIERLTKYFEEDGKCTVTESERS